MKLFHVQDSDRPMYVIALDWQDAIAKWKKYVAFEYETSIEEIGEPQGIHFVADEDDLICDSIDAAE